MQLIGCTKKLQKEMGLGVKDLSTFEPDDSGLGPWTANLIFVNRRKCILFVNDKTLLNFLIPDLLRKHIRELDRMFLGWLSCTLAEEGYVNSQREEILNEYQEIGYTNTRSRSVLGSMNELSFMYKFSIQAISGLHDPRFPEIIKEMNRIPMGFLGYRVPIEALFETIPPSAV